MLCCPIGSCYDWQLFRVRLLYGEKCTIKNQEKAPELFLIMTQSQIFNKVSIATKRLFYSINTQAFAPIIEVSHSFQ